MFVCIYIHVSRYDICLICSHIYGTDSAANEEAANRWADNICQIHSLTSQNLSSLEKSSTFCIAT